MELIERFRLDEVLESVFGRKRAAFMDAHELRDQPAITFQCLPATEFSFDLHGVELQAAMMAGGGPAAQDGWWNAFRVNGRPRPTFDGLTSLSRSYPEKWATELHADGSLLAGLWDFPGGSRPRSEEEAACESAVADFYANAFKDFAFLASQVYEAAKYMGTVYLTSTMHRANRLPLIDYHGQLIAPATKLETVRWPNQSAVPAELATAGASMAERFLRLYGKGAARR